MSAWQPKLEKISYFAGKPIRRISIVALVEYGTSIVQSPFFFFFAHKHCTKSIRWANLTWLQQLATLEVLETGPPMPHQPFLQPINTFHVLPHFHFSFLLFSIIFAFINYYYLKKKQKNKNFTTIFILVNGR